MERFMACPAVRELRLTEHLVPEALERQGPCSLMLCLTAASRAVSSAKTSSIWF